MTRTSIGSGLARWRAKLVAIGVAIGIMAAALLPPGVANVAVDNPAPSAMVSFTFDDGNLSALTQAAPTLQKYDLTGTSYVTTDCVGAATVPDTCRANPGIPNMTWEQILELQNTYGWEIGSHTVTHRCLVSAGNGCQDAKLTPAQVDAELADSKSALAAHGIDATAFAPPYGDYDMSAVAQVAKHYSSMRGFADTGNNIWPLGDYLLRNVPVQEGITSVDTLKSEVDEAIADKTWVVFTFHDIAVNPSPGSDKYQYGTAELDELAAYVQTKIAAGQIKNVNVSQGLVNGSPNMMPNPTFNNGLGGGWRTDAPALITADAANNGSYPDPARSVKLVSGPTQGHLFSPQVAVSPGTNYLYKAYLNVAEITTGEVAFYVDEYNAAGTWVSGQYRKRETSRWVDSLNFTYTPSSSNVATASLQVIVAGVGITAYLDNVKLLKLGAETPPPPSANLLANGSFDAGLGGGWRTDAATNIVADSASNGAPANPVNAVRLRGGAGNTYLFSPQVDVTPGNYSISAYLDIKERTVGELGWYIDEYDADGNWISGQWKLSSTAPGVSNVDLTYSPSTTSVAKASLQVYVTGNSDVLAYVDDVRWWRP